MVCYNKAKGSEERGRRNVHRSLRRPDGGAQRPDGATRLLLDAARKTTHEWCANSLALCQKLDRRMKSEKGIDREGELKLLLMQLAQRA